MSRMSFLAMASKMLRVAVQLGHRQGRQRRILEVGQVQLGVDLHQVGEGGEALGGVEVLGGQLQFLDEHLQQHRAQPLLVLQAHHRAPRRRLRRCSSTIFIRSSLGSSSTGRSESRVTRRAWQLRMA